MGMGPLEATCTIQYSLLEEVTQIKICENTALPMGVVFPPKTSTLLSDITVALC